MLEKIRSLSSPGREAAVVPGPGWEQELLGGDGGSATESPPGPLSPPGFKIGAVLVCLPHMDIVKA